MKRRFILFLMIAGSLLLAVAATAGGAGMKPGLWEINTTMELPGLPFAPPPTTMTHCYTAEEVGDRERFVPQQEGDCRVTDTTTSGNRITWTVVCSGENSGRGSGEMVFTGDSAYTGSMVFEMEGMTMKSRYQARRLGNCQP
jgi:hypothetical protein